MSHPTTRFDREDATELIFGTNEEADRPGLLIDLRGDEGEQVLEGQEQLPFFD